MPKVKNIIIFVSIAAVFVLIYVFYRKSVGAPTANLVSSPSANTLPNVNTTGNSGTANTNDPNAKPFVAKDFLVLLLNVKNIKLNDSIFSDPAFISLKDNPIDLKPDNTEGRPNPFAQFGNDALPATLPATVPTCASPQVLNPTNNTCITPPAKT